MSKFKILIGLTGSIACYKSCYLISKLTQNDFEVKAVCSDSALKFIGISTIEGLTNHFVYTDLFASKSSLEHISLTKWYDLAIICPATANVINKFSQGIANDLISTIFLAQDFSKPFLIAPAMNKNMYLHPATQNSIKTLTEWGVNFVEPANGHQACGDVGPGRLAEPNEIFERILSYRNKT